MKKMKKYMAILLVCMNATTALASSTVYANQDYATYEQSVEDNETAVDTVATESTENSEITESTEIEDTKTDVNEEETTTESSQIEDTNENNETSMKEEVNQSDSDKEETADKTNQATETENTKEIIEMASGELSESVSGLYNETDLDSSSLYTTKTLIVVSDHSDFENCNAIKVINYDNMYILQYETEEEAKDAYKKLKDDNNIVSVEIDAVIESQTESDIENTESSKEKSDLALFLDSKEKNSEVKVAILDSGIDKTNEIFQDRLIDLNINLSSTGDENSIEDDNGHGTDMAEIIVNNTPSTVKIMPIKIANDSGKATVLNAYLGIKAAIENNADIINISMGTINSSSSAILSSIIEEAVSNQIIVVAAAGNDNANVENYTPANIDSVITVSATDSNGEIASFSNYGDKIDYSSIGEDGTSTATANVSAIIAVIKSIYSDYSLEDIHNLLKQYAVDLGEEGFDKYYGYGFISFEELKSKSTDVEKEDNSILNMPHFNTLTDEEINEYLDNSEPWQIGKYLSELSNDDYDGIIASNTNITGEITLYDLVDSKDENGEDIVLTNNPKNMKYYEFCLQEFDQEKEFMKTNGTFSSQTGYYKLGFSKYDGSSGEVRINFKFNNTDSKSSKSLKASSSSGNNKIWTSNASGTIYNFILSSAKTEIAEFRYSVLQVKAKMTLPACCYMSSGGTKYDAMGRMTFKYYGTNNLSLTKTPDDNDREVNFEMSVNVRNAGIYDQDDATHENVHNTMYLNVVRDSFLQTVKVRYQNADALYGNYIEDVNSLVEYGTTFSWNKAETDVYEAKSIDSYTVTSANTKEVTIKRKSNVSATASVNASKTSSGWYQGLPQITFAGSDPNLNISSVTVNNILNSGSGVTKTASEGMNTYSYFATNVNETSCNEQNITIFADASVPKNVFITAATSWSNNTVPLTIKGQDTLSGLASLKIQYSSNNSSWRDYKTKTYCGDTSPQTYAGFSADQNGYYRVVATDRVGNVTISSNCRVTNIDKSAPTLTYTIDGELKSSGWYKGDAVLNLEAQDIGGSGIKSITVNSSETSGSTTSINVVKEGSNYYLCYATDNASNMTAPKWELTIKVDKSAPINLSITPNTTKWTKDPIIITAKADDSHSGVDTIELQYTADIGNPDWREYNTVSLKGTNQVSSDISVTDNGYYRLVVTDQVGFQTVSDDKNILKIDNYDPDKPDASTIGIEPNTIQWVDEATGVEVTSYGSDELSGLSEVAVLERNEIGNFVPKKTEDFSGETTVESTAYDTHINEFYKTRVTDQARNALEMLDEEALEIDNIDPEAPELTIESVSAQEGFISTTEGYVIWAVIEDSQSGFAEAALQRVNENGEWEDYKTQYQIIEEDSSEQDLDVYEEKEVLTKAKREKVIVAVANNISLQRSTSDASNDNTKEVRKQGDNQVIIEYTVRENGTYRLRGVDLVQNKSYTNDTIEITNLDGSKPVIQVEGNPTIWQNTDAAITVIATDADSKITKMTLDGDEKSFQEGVDGTFHFTFDVTKNQEFTVTAVDEAGNSTSQIITVTKIDKEAPVLETGIKKSWFSMILGDYRNLRIDTIDDLSGIAKVSVTCGEQETILKSYKYENAKINFQGNYKIYEEGDYKITITDQAGNITTQTISEANLDFSAPWLKVEGNPTIWQNTDAAITVTSFDEDSKIKAMTLDGEEQEIKQNDEGDYYFTFAATKNQTVVVAAYDEADNMTAQVVRVTKIDKEIPTIQIEPSAIWHEDGYRNMKYEGADNLSGIDTITIEHEGAKETVGSYSYETKQKSTADEYRITDNGDYIVTIKDHAGNTGVHTLTETDAKVLKAIEVVVLPDKTTYYETQNFKKKGMVVDAIYNDNSRKQDIKDYIILNGINLPLAQAQINLSYTENGVTVYTDTPIKVIEKAVAPEDPEIPETVDNQEALTVENPELTPESLVVEEAEEIEEEVKEEPTIEAKNIPENTVLTVKHEKLPIGAILAGAGLLIMILFLLLSNVKIYCRNEEGEWKLLGKTRALKSKERYAIKVSKLMKIRAASNSYKLVFSKMFKKFHEECDLIIKIDKQDYEKYLTKDSDTVYVEHKE
ncbi:S8 family serine peptidase [Lachnotalea glycerini]|nr:S8 family serine peptidase [Lachnotalea glycerini]